MTESSSCFWDHLGSLRHVRRRSGWIASFVCGSFKYSVGPHRIDKRTIPKYIWHRYQDSTRKIHDTARRRIRPKNPRCSHKQDSTQKTNSRAIVLHLVSCSHIKHIWCCDQHSTAHNSKTPRLFDQPLRSINNIINRSLSFFRSFFLYIFISHFLTSYH